MDGVIPFVVVHLIRNSGILVSLTADEDNVKDALRFSPLPSRATELMAAKSVWLETQPWQGSGV